MIVIGVDCATQDERIGLAKGSVTAAQLTLLEAASGKDRVVTETILT